MRRIAAIWVMLGSTSVFASGIGQPVDCDDWAFEQTGLACTDWQPYPCDGGYCSNEGTTSFFDNQGRLLTLETSLLPDNCLLGRREIRVEATAPDGSVTVLARLRDTCNNDVHDQVLPEFVAAPLLFDDKKGTLLVKVFLRSRVRSPGSPIYPEGRRVFEISGFTPAFEVFQSYSPLTSWSLRVPPMPEALSSASFFDTYYGDLATVGDWSRAQPLQCGYPATPPAPGDYLTVGDPLPELAPGQGRYYITAVNYQGQRRYGRKSEGGVLSGRDSAALPGCE